MGKNKPIISKKCIKCTKEKPKEEFSKSKRTSDKLQTYCKECFKSYLLKIEDNARGNRPKYAHIEKETERRIDLELRIAHQFVKESCFENPSEFI